MTILYFFSSERFKKIVGIPLETVSILEDQRHSSFVIHARAIYIRNEAESLSLEPSYLNTAFMQVGISSLR